MTDLAENLLQSSVKQLEVFSQAAFGVGLELADAANAAQAPQDAGGLQMLSRPIGYAPEGRRFLRSHCFLPDETAAAATRANSAKTVPRLTPGRVQLFDAFMDMAAGMLGTIGDAQETAAVDPLREALWRDLLGAPTIVGVSAAAAALRAALPAAANSGQPLFLAGEPGSGRRWVAAAVHRSGPRAQGPFVAEDFASVPAPLREAELFGTGNSPGLLAAAAGGTLYLASVERLAAPAQARLLAHLRRNRTGPEEAASPRLIAASDADLEEIVRRGRFDPDLAARLRTVVLPIPSLRDRPEDIPLIATHLLRRRAAALGVAAPELTPEALNALKNYPWPANVRELDEELARAGAGRTVIAPEDLSALVFRAAHLPGSARGNLLRDAVSELEAGLIARTLAENNWNKSRSARVLGLSRLGLQKKIDRYGIDRRR